MKTRISFNKKKKKKNYLEVVYKVVSKIQECSTSAISFAKTNSSIENIKRRLEPSQTGEVVHVSGLQWFLKRRGENFWHLRIWWLLLISGETASCPMAKTVRLFC